MKRSYYKKRTLAHRLREGLEVGPVVVLTGARQTGKTTLLLREPPFCEWPRFSLDDPETLSFVKERPKDVVAAHDKVVIDEVQKAPELLSYIKLAVDEDRDRRFVLSGSANLLLMSRISESLAGRAVYFSLFPFSLHEYFERSGPHWLFSFLEGGKEKFYDIVACREPPEGETLDFLLLRGFLPPVTRFSLASHIALWWKGYVTTYLERDLRDFSRIFDVVPFHRFMEISAIRAAGIFKQNEAARDVSLSNSTASRYVGLLEASGLFHRLRPFFANLAKRLTKTPKIYYLDTGLTCSLAGFKRLKDLTPEFKAKLFESLVFQNLYVWASYLDGSLHYFRTMGGREIEVDFVVEAGGRLFAFEVKYKERVDLRDIRPLLSFSDLLKGKKEVSLMAVIYAGDEVRELPGGVVALPWWVL